MMRRITSIILSVVLMLTAFCVLGVTVSAGVRYIENAEQLLALNENNIVGATYVISSDINLNSNTCVLSNGRYTIDFNGFTIQSNNRLGTTFSIQGADVVFCDSKVNFKKGDEENGEKPSVRSYGTGAIEVLSGNLTINSGAYIGRSDGFNSPNGICVNGGTCTVYDGIIDGDYVGASCSNGGKLYIHGGRFETSYMFALIDSGNGDIKISQGLFINSNTNPFSPTFVFGAYNNSNVTYSFDKWLFSISPSEPSSYFNSNVNTLYWTGNNNDISTTPSKTTNGNTVIYPYAVSYTHNNIYQAAIINVLTDNPIIPTQPTEPAQQTCDEVGHHTKIVSKKAATYFAKGYTGDKKCTVCGKVVSKGKALDKLKLATPKVKITAGKQKLTVKYTKVKDATGFQVKYIYKGKAKTVTFTTSKTITKVIKKLKKGTYKVSVRALIKSKGKTAYSNWTKAKKAKVK